MIPSPEDVARTRLLVSALLRVVGTGLGFVALASIVSWLVEGMVDDDIWAMGYYAGRIGSAVVLLTAAAVMIAIAPWLARLLVPCRLDPRCPSCRYLLLGLSGNDRCPECALPLTPAMVNFPASLADEHARRAVQLAQWAAIVRWIGIAIAALAGAIVVATTLGAILDPDDPAGLLAPYVVALALAAPGAGLILLSAALKRHGRTAREHLAKTEPPAAP